VAVLLIFSDLFLCSVPPTPDRGVLFLLAHPPVDLRLQEQVALCLIDDLPVDQAEEVCLHLLWEELGLLNVGEHHAEFIGCSQGFVLPVMLCFLPLPGRDLLPGVQVEVDVDLPRAAEARRPVMPPRRVRPCYAAARNMSSELIRR